MRASLNGGLVEKPLHEVMKVNPVLPLRTQNVRGAKTMGYLLKRAANREWNQLKRKKCVTVNKAE